MDHKVFGTVVWAEFMIAKLDALQLGLVVVAREISCLENPPFAELIAGPLVVHTQAIEHGLDLKLNSSYQRIWRSILRERTGGGVAATTPRFGSCQICKPSDEVSAKLRSPFRLV